MDGPEFRRELDRRLAIVENPDYEDPAAADLPARDLVILLLGSAGLVIALLAWGYPW
jgi:hypothetical protein